MCRNPFVSIVARGLELIQVYDEALQIIKEYFPIGPSRMAYQPQEGSGCAATEAPRGLLFHRYQIDDAGKIASATIIPPTSQNQRQIETDLKNYLSRKLQAKATREELAVDCERLVRTYDPCISCSTHFLKIHWQESA